MTLENSIRGYNITMIYIYILYNLNQGTFLSHTGRLPIEVDMDEVNMDTMLHDALAESKEESPPPIPPRCS